MLLERVSPRVRRGQSLAESCDYGSFQKTSREAGDSWFSREMVCFEDRHRILDVKVVDLSFNPSVDPALFAPPPGAVEIDACPVQPERPRAISTLNPVGHFGQYRVVELSLTVDKKGIPQHARVIRSYGKSLDEEALRAINVWRFRPGTCNGEPIAVPIEVNIVFRP